MGPVLKDIKRVFDNYKRDAFDKNGNHKFGANKICQRAPFSSSYWMYSYLFPEICLDNKMPLNGPNAPCFYFTEEQVLRIMAEHGLL